MGHPDSGLILAVMEGEAGEKESSDVCAHLQGCPECREREEELQRASLSTAQVLADLDVEPDLGSARAAVLDRARQQGSQDIHSDGAEEIRFQQARKKGIRWSLPKAASVAIFLTAGAAAALPGSPVRAWLTGLWSDGTPLDSTTAREESPDAADPESQETVGPAAGIAAFDGGVEIWIHDLPDEAELLVRWIDGQEAWIHAGEGTRFTTRQGRIEAFAAPGTVRIDIPRSLERIDVRLNGSVLLQKHGGELEILEPIHRRTPSEILFGSREGTNEGGN